MIDLRLFPELVELVQESADKFAELEIELEVVVAVRECLELAVQDYSSPQDCRGHQDLAFHFLRP